MNISKTELLDLEKQIQVYLKEAGTYIKKHWYSIASLSYKDKRDLSTNIDVEVENILREKLQKLLPEAGFIVEEGSTQTKVEYNWVIDPIDGTKFFATHAPYFFTQLALIQKRQPILGGIYNPISDQLFSGSLGNGARLNSIDINLPFRTSTDEAVIEVDFGKNDLELEWKVGVFKELVKKFYRVRITSGILLPYLFTGTVDAFICLNKDVKQVDLEPGIAIARECNLKSEYVPGNNREMLIISCPPLFDEIKASL